jgi:hypothetical protein
MRAIGERQTPDAALKLRRASLIALCLTTLPACSLGKLWQRDPVPAVSPCPIVQCLDRALRTCEGVEPPSDGVRNCQDAVLLASDALGEVMVCQEAHRLLIQCVEDFNRERGRD